MKISVDNCSVTVIEFDQQGRVRVPRINQTLNDGWLPQR